MSYFCCDKHNRGKNNKTYGFVNNPGLVLFYILTQLFTKFTEDKYNFSDDSNIKKSELIILSSLD